MVEVVEDVVVELVGVGSAGSCWITGRNSSWAVWPTTWSARSRFSTPGSDTMIDSPWRVISGSATPEGVDPVADDLDGLVEDALGNLLPGLEHDGRAALEVEAQLRAVAGDQRLRSAQPMATTKNAMRV